MINTTVYRNALTAFLDRQVPQAFVETLVRVELSATLDLFRQSFAL